MFSTVLILIIGYLMLGYTYLIQNPHLGKYQRYAHKALSITALLFMASTLFPPLKVSLAIGFALVYLVLVVIYFSLDGI